MATMVPSPRQRRIQQLANMLRNKSMSLKLENMNFTMYLIAILRHGASSMPCAWVFAGWVSGRCWEHHTLSRRRWEYHTLSGWRWEYDALSMRREHDSLSATCWEYDNLSAVWLFYYANTLTAVWQGATKKNNNWQYWQLLINDFGQQGFNGAADWSAAKRGPSFATLPTDC